MPRQREEEQVTPTIFIPVKGSSEHCAVIRALYTCTPSSFLVVLVVDDIAAWTTQPTVCDL